MNSSLDLGINILNDPKLAKVFKAYGITDQELEKLDGDLVIPWESNWIIPSIGDNFNFISLCYEIFRRKGIDCESMEILDEILSKKTIIEKRQWFNDHYIELYLKLTEPIELPNKNPLLDIQFNMKWKPSNKFNDIFELVDDNGNVVEVATPNITKYRFKIGMKNWGKVTDTSLIFTACTALTSITLPENWGNITSSQLMFSRCDKLENITLPSSWGNITDTQKMFSGCHSLISIILPNEWGEVLNSSYMFHHCEALTSIELPSEWLKMKDIYGIFAYCLALACVILPESWKDITDTTRMFMKCDSLETITLPNNWDNVIDTEDMFRGSGITEIELPQKWDNISCTNGMFWGCYNLTSITLPENWGNIGTASKHMFDNCYNLTDRPITPHN